MRKKTAEVEVLEHVEDELYKNVRSIIVKARAKVYAVANTALVKAYWDVGREIVEKQGGEPRSRYGDGLVARLSLKLTAEFGPGYKKVNLFYMRRSFLAFPKVHTLCKQLNWSHYRTLIAVKYHLDLPTDEELCLELRRERAAIEEALLLKGGK